MAKLGGGRGHLGDVCNGVETVKKAGKGGRGRRPLETSRPAHGGVVAGKLACPMPRETKLVFNSGFWRGSLLA